MASKGRYTTLQAKRNGRLVVTSGSQCITSSFPVTSKYYKKPALTFSAAGPPIPGKTPHDFTDHRILDRPEWKDSGPIWSPHSLE